MTESDDKLHTNWLPRGLLVPAPPPVPWATSHAALPHAHVLGDGRIRLYFTSRDDRGRSHIGRADADLTSSEAPVEFREEPILGPGPLGAFDDSGVTTSCLVDQGARQLLYYTGWSLGQTVPFYLNVGCAISEDGETFERISPAPILERNAVDPYLTASPWVLNDDGRLRMWYVSGTGWELVDGRPRHRYHVKYAESRDGISWERNGIVCVDFADASEHAFSRPCVVKDADLYRMWFSARGTTYRLGYAESNDGVQWERKDEEAGIASSGDWDSEMQAYPAVFDDGGKRYILYNGNGYGRTGIGWAVATTPSE
jgi:hypothetical protein